MCAVLRNFLLLPRFRRVQAPSKAVLADGVTGNTSDFGSEESRFEPWSANNETPRKRGFFVGRPASALHLLVPIGTGREACPELSEGEPASALHLLVPIGTGVPPSERLRSLSRAWGSAHPRKTAVLNILPSSPGPSIPQTRVSRGRAAYAPWHSGVRWVARAVPRK